MQRRRPLAAAPAAAVWQRGARDRRATTATTSSTSLWTLRGAAGPGWPAAAACARPARPARSWRLGDAVDFWRVVALEPGRRLTLLAEMKLPGSAALDVRGAAAGRAAHAGSSSRPPSIPAGVTRACCTGTRWRPRTR
ncbi:MAG: DUF2867 domain-containing protein [Comamonadaceae bacterium]|nr:DUF2867 domain-containing protein [Comamonadaceae bacterium]